jgi:hypothetical protein
MRARSRGAGDLARFADLERQREIGELKIKISGCINACGHHHVGHIGILGVEKKGESSTRSRSAARPRDTAIGDILGRGFVARRDHRRHRAAGRHLSRRRARRRRERNFIDAYRRLGEAPVQGGALCLRNTPYARLMTETTAAAHESPVDAAGLSRRRVDSACDSAEALAGNGRLILPLASRSSGSTRRPAPIRQGAPGRAPAARRRVVEQIADLLGDLSLVALAFPAFSDGRSFSKAELLRRRYGFRWRGAGDRPGAGRSVAAHAARGLRRIRDQAHPVLLKRLEEGR